MQHINSLNKDRYLFENTMDIKKILWMGAISGEDKGQNLVDLSSV